MLLDTPAAYNHFNHGIVDGAKYKQERSKVENQLRCLASGNLNFEGVDLLDISPNLAKLRVLIMEETPPAWAFFQQFKQKIQNIWEQVLQDRSSHTLPGIVALENATFKDELFFSVEYAEAAAGLVRRKIVDALRQRTLYCSANSSN